MNFQIEKIMPAEIIIKGKPDRVHIRYFRMLLNHYGAELITERNTMIVEKIKSLIIDSIDSSSNNQEEIQEKIKYSDFISKNIVENYNYSYLSYIFTTKEKTTIEKFIAYEKIKRVMQFLIEGELTLKQIAWKLGYSSVHHLSKQFRKVTNMTAREFRKNPKMPPSPQ
ncbi:MAG: AraC family transcriptional regulator [Bacteroidetes bacterium]|nr:AraC family transcriptional regulator [Bacteroidota bacterium]